MTRVTRLLTAAALLSGVAVLVDVTPAAAAVTVVGSGTTVTVTAAGDASINPVCSAGSTGALVAGVTTVATPAVPCATLTKFVVNGDAANQGVFSNSLDSSTFPAGPFVQLNLGDGEDFAYDTLRADSINLGIGNDRLYLQADSVANSSNQMGSGTNDLVSFFATSGNDTIDLTSGSPNIAIAATTGSGTSTQVVNNFDVIRVEGGAGNDEIDATAVSAASSAFAVYLDGGTGANVLVAGSRPTSMVNTGFGRGTMTGGPAFDNFYSYNPLDVLHVTPGDVVYDQYGSHSGGRTVDATGPFSWSTQVSQDDTVARVRPGAVVGSTRVVVSLTRSGIQELPPSLAGLSVDLSWPDGRKKLGLLDVVATGATQVGVAGDQQDDDLADVTVPVGTWTTSGSAATTLTVSTNDPTVGDVYVTNVGPVSVHGPWTNANEGFAHRVTRDLVFRFLTTGQRNTVRDQLASGAKTRAQVIADLVNTDEYRGLDVDRIFRRYLKRDPDPGGKTYWVNAIRGGRSLRKFRAPLFGSNEYFTKAGATNAGFVVAAYTDVLGRAPDPSGQTYWTNKLDSGTSRATVANTFLGSTEARRTIVKEQFLRFLDRYPTAAEVDVWMEPLRTAADGEQALISFLAGSGAYFSRT